MPPSVGHTVDVDVVRRLLVPGKELDSVHHGHGDTEGTELVRAKIGVLQNVMEQSDRSLFGPVDCVGYTSNVGEVRAAIGIDLTLVGFFRQPTDFGKRHKRGC